MIRFLTVVFLLLSFVSTTKASHIIGGEIHYEYLGSNNYRITVKVYRDCSSAVDFDNPVPLTLFDGAGVVITTYDLYDPEITNVPYPSNNPCLTFPPNICVEQAIYEFELNLPPQAGGYTLSYQRCCRNNTIENITQPGNTGATFTTFIPGPPYDGNSDPLFNLFPPTVICANYPLIFDHAALDLNGDSLVYSLCEPFVGGGTDTFNNNNCATCNIPIPATPPSYSSVNFISPYNSTNPMGGSPPISIDPITGLLTGTPTNLGQFVVAICVSEYRNGILLDVHRRDFQFNVAECVQAVTAFAQPSIRQCNILTVAFNDSSIGGFAYHWDFGTSATNDTTNQNDPTFTYPDAGQYTATFVVNPNTLCSDTALVDVDVIDPNNYDISSDTLIYIGASANLSATNGMAYLWQPDSTLSFNDIANPIATPTITTTYTVTITFDTGCIAIDSVVVRVNLDPLVIFPNAFSPNGDGNNDFFKPFLLGFMSVDYFRIYNRWGELVYDSKTIDGWNGKYKNVDQDIGTYAYYFKGKSTLSPKIVEYQGNFTLVR